jgi:hypothetical protein
MTKDLVVQPYVTRSSWRSYVDEDEEGGGGEGGSTPDIE